MTRRERVIGIGGAIAKELCLMLAAAATLIAIAEGISWACILTDRGAK